MGGGFYTGIFVLGGFLILLPPPSFIPYRKSYHIRILLVASKLYSYAKFAPSTVGDRYNRNQLTKVRLLFGRFLYKIKSLKIALSTFGIHVELALWGFLEGEARSVFTRLEQNTMRCWCSGPQARTKND